MYIKPQIIAIPYRTFKQRIQLTKKYLKEYTVEDLGGVLYMKKR